MATSYPQMDMAMAAHSPAPAITDALAHVRVHLLDVGHEQYSDCSLVVLGERRILVDGAHASNAHADGSTPSITSQLQTLLGEDRPRIDLLVVSHTHLDHIGALPALVSAKALDIEWALVSDAELGWGRGIGEDALHLPDPKAQALLAVLREEPLPPSASDSMVDAWIADSVGLDVTYEAMLKGLADQGTKVVRYGRDDAVPLAADLKDIGLEVFGPSQAHLIAAAKAIADRTKADADSIMEALSVDAERSPLEIYRSLIAGSSADASQDRPGTYVNLQSIVLGLGPKSRRLLFTGDMQLAKPGASGTVIPKEIESLRQRLRKRRFAFVKLPHHGSENGFDDAIAPDFGSPDAYGIIGGSDGKGHPSKTVLDLLKASAIPFVRTDRNGQSSVGWTAGNVEVGIARGTLSDPTPNTAVDAPSTRTSVPVAVTSSKTAATSSATARAPVMANVSSSGDRDVHVELTIPHVSTTVRVTLEVTPGQAPFATASSGAVVSTARPDSPGGLPRLLYVTEPAALARNTSENEVANILADLRARPGMVLTIEAGWTVDAAIERTREGLANDPNLAGVVLVGGYDVVPSQSVDTVPAHLHDRIRRGRDADSFVVWSDTNYGYRRDRRQLPVSRVPDGRLGSLLTAALSPPTTAAGAPRGVRNINRPFAESVFSLVEDDQKLWVSEDATPALVGQGLAGRLIYLMLHGSRVDGTRLWGEAGELPFEAVTLKNIGNLPGAVVFMGACWGGLISDLRAIDYQEGVPIPPRLPENSIAMACLAAGARAVIACTGSHYSPVREPYEYYGGPIHRDFLKAYMDGSPPALALLAAKQAYAAAMPHGRTDPDDQAIEYKMIWQFTCLGLGW
jgi:beta-lactamase superfamily II metal-dependent hydrolase